MSSTTNFAYPATVINQMIEEKVTIFSGVPSTYAYLLHRSPLSTHNKQQTTPDNQQPTTNNQLPHLRLVTQAGGHMAKSVKIALRKALPNHTKICIMYGATEASARLTYLDPDFFTKKIDSIGKPIPEVVIRIINDKGNKAQQGTIGEVVASGANIMMGYWKDPVSTEKVLNEHAYHTGDIGWIDEDGFIFLEGRKDNLLKVGGHRINTQEIEDALIATDLLVEASVVGLPDDLLGNKLVALAVPLNGDHSKDLILQKCSQVLPKYKLPTDIISVKSIPKNANGKIDKKECIKVVNKQLSTNNEQQTSL